MDGVLLAAGLAVNFLIWLNIREGRVSPEYARQFVLVAPGIVGLKLALFAGFGLYRTIARHAGRSELILIALADTIVAALVLIFDVLTPFIRSFGPFPLHPSGDHLLRVPLGIVFNDWMLTLIVIPGVRFLRREIEFGLTRPRGGLGRRVLIVGAGDAGEQVARDLERATGGAFRPVAFVDPDARLTGLRIHGLPVAGTLEDLPSAIAAHSPDELVIALPMPSPRVLSAIVAHCRSARLGIKIVPPLSSVMTGGVEISTLRPIEIEDLLGREPVHLASPDGSDYLKGKRVLVTGAGGSIGLELCRQAIAGGAGMIILLGRGENSLFEALLELRPAATAGQVDLRAVVADARDRPAVEAIFQTFRPEIVFHAAAHKHVHFMEVQPCEAVKNNVGATLVVAEAAVAAGAERFILISTDKAVRPTGFMGATKRCAEVLVRSLGTTAPVRFMSVRFGNVLGSRGSVIPTFRRQIAQGGPVTVTHPEATRYFMTLTEAVSLVIQAGARGQGGELFVLDMGSPVRIADLARNLITLSGLEPEIDVPLVYTGLRPGEKLTEELLAADEAKSVIEGGKIFVARDEARPWPELRPRLIELLEAAARNDAVEVGRLLKALTPEFEAGPAVGHSSSRLGGEESDETR